MQRVLDYADLFLVASGLAAVVAISMGAAALGFDPKAAAVGSTVAVSLVHGLLFYAVRRLQRAAYHPPALRLLNELPEPR